MLDPKVSWSRAHDLALVYLALAYGTDSQLSTDEMDTIVGALHGRVLPDEDDSYCRELSARYRERFVQEIGATRCADLRENGYGSDGEWPCSVLVERATRVLLEVLREAE